MNRHFRPFLGRIRPVFLTSLAVLTGCMSGLVSFADSPPARIVSMKLMPEKIPGEGYQLILEIENGAFDPALTWVNTEKGNFRILIEGDDVELDPQFQHDSLGLTQEFQAISSQIQGVHLFQSGNSGHPNIKITLDSKSELHPIIRSNTGSIITIGMVGNNTRSAAPRVSESTLAPRIEIEDGIPVRKREEEPTITKAPKVAKAPKEPRSKGSSFWKLPAFTAQEKSAPSVSEKPVKKSVEKTVEKPVEKGPKLSKASNQPVLPGSNPSIGKSAGLKTGANTQSIYTAVLRASADDPLRTAWDQYRSGQIDAASATLKQMLATTPTHRNARYLLALNHLTGHDRPAAVLELQKLISQTASDKPYLPAWLDLLSLEVDAGHFKESTQLLQKALKIWPEHPDFQYYEGLTQEVQGNLAQAQAAYLRALSIAPNHPMYHYRLALVELKAKHSQAAEQELQRVLMFNPENVEALKLLGFLAQKSNENELALKYYQQAIRPDTLIGFAALLQKENRPDLAAALLQTAELLEPNNADIQFNLGMLYADAKDAEATKRTLGHFMSLVPDPAKDARIEKVQETFALLGISP